MLRVTQTLWLLTFVGFLSACAEKPRPLEGISDEVFEVEPEATGSLSTVGQLAEAHVENTFALRRANNKLLTLCIAAQRCESEDRK